MSDSLSTDGYVPGCMKCIKLHAKVEAARHDLRVAARQRSGAVTANRIALLDCAILKARSEIVYSEGSINDHLTEHARETGT